ncbi:unnamed protein product [Sphagnum troendelagicum]
MAFYTKNKTSGFKPDLVRVRETTKLGHGGVAAKCRWSLDSRKSKTALQRPTYTELQALEGVLNTLESSPPSVFAGEARSLEERLEDTARGRAFLLQGGDCAERFKEFNANNIRDTFHILLRIPLSSCLEANRQL